MEFQLFIYYCVWCINHNIKDVKSYKDFFEDRELVAAMILSFALNREILEKSN